jgi:hypothetical protein
MSKLHPHVFVLSWPAAADNVTKIIDAMSGLDCRKTVIDTSRTVPAELNGWEYIGITDDTFYGRQMELAVRLFDGDVFIGINGDAQSEDWAGLVNTCMARFETMPQIGVWSPEIDNTGWPTERVSLGPTTDLNVHVVAQTGSIVWALRAPIVERFRTLDLFANNRGWGIDWVAIVAAYTQGLVAVRDRKVTIHLPISESASIEEAQVQMRAMFDALSTTERVFLCLLHRALAIRTPFTYQLP